MIDFKDRQPMAAVTRQRYAVKRALALLRHQRRLLIHGACSATDTRNRPVLSTLDEAARANIEWYTDVIKGLEEAFNRKGEKA